MGLPHHVLLRAGTSPTLTHNAIGVNMQLIFNYLIFPGLLFSCFMGGLGWWFERKLTARFQYRVGPPWYQNFIDVAKLFLKETIVPEKAAKILFFLSPIVTFSAAILFNLIAVESFFLKKNFIGDILVMFYLLIIPSLFIILGAFSSANSLALVGATREIKLMLAYELVFIVSLIITIIKANGTLTMASITSAQLATGPFAKSYSGFIALVLAISYFQAKLGIAPFDAAEAEQEIMAGTMIEYCGPLLGFYRLTKMLLYFSVPLFIISLLGYVETGSIPKNYLIFFLEYIGVMLIVSVIKNINPRSKIKDILRFFWFWLFPLGIFGIILALKGL
jgi:NADH-quinone oxidoreductase subunit H